MKITRNLKSKIKNLIRTGIPIKTIAKLKLSQSKRIKRKKHNLLKKIRYRKYRMLIYKKILIIRKKRLEFKILKMLNKRKQKVLKFYLGRKVKMIPKILLIMISICKTHNFTRVLPPRAKSLRLKAKRSRKI